MTKKYVVKYFLGKLEYGVIKTFQIYVEANSEEEAKKIAIIQLKYGQRITKPRIFAVELDNS